MAADGTEVSPAFLRPGPLVRVKTLARDAEPSGDAEPLADEDAGDLPAGVDEDALEHDELDTDRVTSTEAVSAAMRFAARRRYAESLRR